MSKLKGMEEKIVAILHDVVEDGGVTLDELTQSGFSGAVVRAIDCLTKRPREPYENFITRLSSDALARAVKIEDIKDNLDLTRLTSLGDEDLSRVQKYHSALRFLLMLEGV